MTSGNMTTGQTRPHPHGFADAALWRSMLSSKDPVAFSEAWLTLFAAQVDLVLGPQLGLEKVVTQGMIALGDPLQNKYTRTAVFDAKAEISPLLAKTAERAMQVRHGTVQTGDGKAGACLLAHPILQDDGLYGVAAIELAPAAHQQLDLIMRLIQWGVAWFTQLFRAAGRGAGALDGHSALLAEVCSHGVSGVTAAAAAEAVATFLAERLAVQKVSFGVRRGLETRILALSHGGFSDILNDFLVSLIAAMEEAADYGASVCYPVADNDLAMPHAAQAKLCRSHDCDWSIAVPVDAPWGDADEQTLIILAQGNGQPSADLLVRLEELARLLAPLFIGRLRGERSLQDHARERLAQEVAKIHGLSQRQKLIAATAIPLVLLLLGFARLDHKVGADATLEGAQRRAIVAPFDGYLAEATVRPGDRVTEGQVLGQMDDRELGHQRNEISERMAETDKEITEAMGRWDTAKVNILTARKAQIQAELDLVEEGFRRAKLTAPFDGFVALGDKTQSIGAPLHRGDILYELSPLDKFRVVLEVPQADFADVQVGQEGKVLLSSVPYQSFPLKITRITPIASAHEGKTVLRVEGDLESKDSVLRPGMQGVADINVGPRRILWIAAHRPLDWLRLKLWEWLP